MNLEPRELTVGFADIARFSEKAQSLGEEGAIDCLQRFYEIAGDSIVAAGGTLLKLIGDSILFYFPSGCEAEALGCAKAMVVQTREVIGELNVGLASGTVHAGEMGHATCRQFELIGDKVNLAARLCNLGGVVADCQTASAAGQENRCDELAFEAVGKQFQAFRVCE